MDNPISESELEKMMDRAAEAGARRALASIGLHDEEAATDVRELRGLLEAWRSAKDTALKTFVSWAIKMMLVVIVAGVWWKTGGNGN